MIKTTIAIRRNTAIKTESMVETTGLSLIRDEVPVGAMVWGFDPTVPANEPLVYCVDGEGSRDWTQHVEHPFLLYTWAAKKIFVANLDTGEENPAVRITLIDPEGESLSFASVGIAASLDLIRTLRGDGPFEPAIPVTFRKVDTRRGWATIKMRPVMEVKTSKK